MQGSAGLSSMGWNCLTDRPSRAAFALAVLLLLGALPVDAHDLRRSAGREILRLQGFRGSAPKEFPAARPLTLLVLGEESRFFVTESQTFGGSEGETVPSPAAHERYELQASRELLGRFAAARPEQRVTLLAERRPGGTDLFLLSVDLCPPR